ncbi:hypothetical protein HPP92_004207 [Vanilla planifolia]|uniref:C2H2-type domain-containing protein n=1 Tax=Vanilla planifolia TaxID=51239 RepID=A0A835S3X5_VANPL|nr:hypothetical protein HPP92_004207 [Vanilla planifolia]
MFEIRPSSPPPTAPAHPPSAAEVTSSQKRKRRPAGTPDPEAEVISLSPRTLLESDRYVCEICNLGFQRDQNLQMHRRRHKVPWKLAKREEAVAKSDAARKKVYVCPEPSCLHHDPCHALGDLVGIKKHFRRKHSMERQWSCARCSKAYAVQSDYKAHLKTCGTRGHSCDCGRVFSRVESFIEHQDSCNGSIGQPEARSLPLALSLFRTASTETASGGAPPCRKAPFLPPPASPVIDLRLFSRPALGDDTELHLSIGPPPVAAEKVGGDKSRVREVETAERELAAARRIRQQAQAEFEKACALRVAAARHVKSIVWQITCNECRKLISTAEICPP